MSVSSRQAESVREMRQPTVYAIAPQCKKHIFAFDSEGNTHNKRGNGFVLSCNGVMNMNNKRGKVKTHQCRNVSINSIFKLKYGKRIVIFMLFFFYFEETES